MKIDYTKLTFTELIDKIEVNRFFDLPRMVREAFRRLTPQAPKYKVYTALLTQTGTDAPVATVLENTLGGDVVWSYSSEGTYIGTLSGGFVEDNTKLEIGLVTDTDYTSVYFGNFYRIDNDSVGLATLDFSQSSIDGTLNNTPIEIRVYN